MQGEGEALTEGYSLLEIGNQNKDVFRSIQEIPRIFVSRNIFSIS